jgi:hypothetical protein
MMKAKRFKFEELRCLAFGQTDKRQCRLDRRPGEKTCNIHRNYYTSWFKTHKPFLHRIHVTDRELAEYMFQLKGGHLLIPTDHIESLSESYQEYYMFLMEHTALSPSSNPTLLRASLSTLLYKVYKEQHRISWLFYETMDHYFKWALRDTLSCIHVFNEIVHFAYTYALDISLMISPSLSYTILQTVLERVFLKYPEWRQLNYSTLPQSICKFQHTEFEKSGYHSFHLDNVSQILIPILKNVVSLFKATHQSAVVERIRPYKEELIAQACHPRHLQRWLDSGYTLDIFDQMGWD